jgi:general secretion pathway protein D
VSNLVLSSLAAVSTDTLSDVVTNKRTIQTTVLVDDRQTIVLGGLIQDDLQDTEKRVPLLGDIPWLGKLFRNTEQRQTKRSLLVFLRPTVLRTAEEVDVATSRKYEKVWEVKIDGDAEHSEPLPPLDSIYDGRPD